MTDNPDAYVRAIEAHIHGWRSATFGWQSDPDPKVEWKNRQRAIQEHAAECLHRIAAEMHAAGVALPANAQRVKGGSPGERWGTLSAEELARVKTASGVPVAPAGRKRLCRDCADLAQDGICPNDGKPCASAGVRVGPPWCCEEGERLNMKVCPNCADTAPDVGPPPIAEVRIEPDYWSRGHFYEGHRKQVVAITDIEHLPAGTKLYAHPPISGVDACAKCREPGCNKPPASPIHAWCKEHDRKGGLPHA